MSPHSTFTPEKAEDFCAVLSRGESPGAAADAIGVSRRTAYTWRKQNPEFKLAWDAAIERGTDELEDEAKRRAWAGVEKPVFYQGAVVGHVREYSDTLLIFLLKARREKFRETQIVFNVDYSQLNDEQLARLASGEHPRAVLASDSELASDAVQ